MVQYVCTIQSVCVIGVVVLFKNLHFGQKYLNMRFVLICHTTDMSGF